MTQIKESIKTRIDNQEAKICVIGLGQVGLPTALTFCDVGFDVTGHDINEELLKIIDQGKSPFEEVGLENLIKSCKEKRKFHTNINFEEAVKNSDVIIVCVSTSINEETRPNLSALENVCNSLSEQNLDGKLIIIESSIPPGTFQSLVLSALQRKNNIGQNCWTAFVPERLAPGQAISEIRSTPRVIGYSDRESGLLAKTLYQKVVASEILITPVLVAEISKLAENTFRDVNVALANEMGLICEKYGIDIAELLKVCNSHPRVNILKPGPGVGGPCLPKDPYLLLNPQGKESIKSKIILESRKINDHMPHHVVELITKALDEQNLELSNSTVLVLGVSYKANVSDTRYSPSAEIIPNLIKKGAQVLVYDPFSSENFGGKSISNVWDAMSSSDVLVVVTDHDDFKKFNLKEIKAKLKNPIIVDTRRIFSSKEAENLGIKYLGVGYTTNLKM